MIVYGAYHFSDAKIVINQMTGVGKSFRHATEGFKKTSGDPDQVMDFLRKQGHSLTHYIPGGDKALDDALDALEKVKDKHGDETKKIVKGTYGEISDVVKDGKMDISTGTKLLEILKRRGAEVQKLAEKAGGDLMDEYPDFRGKIGEKYSELKGLAHGQGEKGKKIMDDVQSSLKDIAKEGLNKDSLNKAQELVQNTIKELQK